VLLALVSESAAEPGGLYRSDDRGLHWRRVSGSFAWPDPQALVIGISDPDRLYLAARQTWSAAKGTAPGGVFASADGGASWTRVLSDTFVDALAVDPGDADVVYAGGVDHPYHDDAIGTGVRCSRDGGKTWVSLNTPELANRNIDCLTLDPRDAGRLYAGTGGSGVFLREECARGGAARAP
jgi:photosystem II stability/assembly factor-like uncharacterized protein